MGIDIYMTWDGMSEEERHAQYTGFSVVAGGVGYLREAYHGEPYATRVLVPEAFEESPDGHEWGPRIPASLLKKRLPGAMEAALQRERVVYKNARASKRSLVVQSYAKFVALAAAKEKETGNPVRVTASW